MLTLTNQYYDGETNVSVNYNSSSPITYFQFQTCLANGQCPAGYFSQMNYSGISGVASSTITWNYPYDNTGNLIDGWIFKFAAMNEDSDYIVVELPVNVGASDDMLGDVNQDGQLNVLDVVSIVGEVLGDSPPSFDAGLADINQDGQVNILDVVMLVQQVLGTRSSQSRSIINRVTQQAQPITRRTSPISFRASSVRNRNTTANMSQVRRQSRNNMPVRSARSYKKGGKVNKSSTKFASGVKPKTRR